jgi:hypothetical protein
MNSIAGGKERAMSSSHTLLRSIVRMTLTAVLLAGLAACRKAPPGTFETPEQAVEALNAALAQEGTEDLEVLFGPGSIEHLRSGDPVADKQDVEHVRALIAEKVTFEDFDDHTKIASFGNDPWPFPFPLVSEDERWRFDLEGGIEELHSRRIGGNELFTLATLHAYVDAQREYFRRKPMGEPPVFAQKFMSDEGSRNGLYWPTAEGEEPSPLGDLVAEASLGGYNLQGDGDGSSSSEPAEDAGPQPYHGYHFRILTGQGEHVPGSGARSYLDAEGRMRTGFAAVAWPASYGNSGIMTFQVNQWGMVFQKDLGEETPTAVEAITVFDPDQTWEPTGD